MKKYIVIAILSTVALVSCRKKDIAFVKTSLESPGVADPSAFVIDSLKITDSITLSPKLSLVYNNRVLEFPGIKDRSLLDSIYQPTGLVFNEFSKEKMQETLLKSKQEFFRSSKEVAGDIAFQQTWDNTSRMSLFRNQDGIISLQYVDSGFTGGAHGYYNENYKNFDLQSNTVIHLKDIVKNVNDKFWEKRLMDSFIKKDENNQKEMLLVDQIPLTSNLYFGKNSITFVYNPYEITAYAAGTIYITLFYDEIKNYLKSDYLKRVGYK